MSNIKHNMAHTRIYRIWLHMKNRCYNINDNRYNDWGGRGIKVCDEWLNDFQAFYEWALNNGYKENLTIDRINVNGNYESNNCRWVDYKIQNRNSRRNRYITLNGETRCLSEWCEILNLNYLKVHRRINRDHWTIKQALELEER